MELLLYSARFACPGMLIFAHFEYTGTPGKALRTTPFRKECPGVGAVAKGRYFWPSLALCNIPGSHIFGKSRFLKKRSRLTNCLTNRFGWVPSREAKIFLKNAGQYSPQRSLRQRGAPHLEPLLYSARFACPGMLTFAHFEYSGTPGKALRTTLNAFRKECPGVGAVAKGRHFAPSLALWHISGSHIF